MKKIVLLILFMFLCSPVYALTIIDSDVLYDETSGLYWYRNVKHFSGMSYYEVEDEVTRLSAEMDYDWRIAELNETYDIIYSINGYYETMPEAWFYNEPNVWVNGATQIRIYDDAPDGTFSFLIECPELIYDSHPDGSFDVWGGEGIEIASPHNTIDYLLPGAWVVGTAAPVPEPATFFLLCTGLIPLVYRKTKKRTS